MIDFGPTSPYRSIAAIRAAFSAQKADKCGRRGAAKERAKLRAETEEPQ